MTTLFIDTTSNIEISVGLIIDGQRHMEDQKLERKKAQVVIPMIEDLLKEHKLDVANIDAVELKEGPGSFTGLRVGAAIANTLGAFLNIPINGRKNGEYIEPVYS